MSRKKHSTKDETCDPDLMDHIRSLGLRTVGEYRRWCAKNGFGRKLRKHWKQQCRERFHATSEAADARLAQKKWERRKTAEVLKGICNCEISEDDVTEPGLKGLCKSIRNIEGQRDEKSANRRTLLRLLLHVESKCGFLDPHPVVPHFGHANGNTYFGALISVAAHHGSWVRPVEEWKPRTHNTGRQFASLVRHLFAKYEVPLFFDSVWFAGRSQEATRQRTWYKHVAAGHNIRTCDLPVPLTKKMAHHFMHAPNDLSVMQALRWGQIHGLGGNARLARAILGTRLGERFLHDDFWVTVIRWLIANPALGTVHVGPIVDYLHHQRFVPQHVFFGPGRREETPPPQPNLTMKGRAPETLLRKVSAWHRRLGHDNSSRSTEWARSGIEEFDFVEGSRESGNLKCWTIRELLSSKDLFAEGRKMKHCVATYVSLCARGESSIWTMEVESLEGRSKLLTIEVANKRRTICQVRRKANRLPTEKDLSVLRRWAARSGLTLAGHV